MKYPVINFDKTSFLTFIFEAIRFYFRYKLNFLSNEQAYCNTDFQ